MTDRVPRPFLRNKGASQGTPLVPPQRSGRSRSLLPLLTIPEKLPCFRHHLLRREQLRLSFVDFADAPFDLPIPGLVDFHLFGGGRFGPVKAAKQPLRDLRPRTVEGEGGIED